METSSVLQDEDWRMTLDLPAGDYHAVAYGGLECDKASFSHTKAVDNIKTLADLQVAVNGVHTGDEAARPATPLHDLFHGALDFTVTDAMPTTCCPTAPSPTCPGPQAPPTPV